MIKKKNIYFKYIYAVITMDSLVSNNVDIACIFNYFRL